ncbi:MAG: TRAP transporter small permease [Devosiaceae bacterium]|nr:TRAP transporter small permease [Devosiaceae bacterium]
MRRKYFAPLDDLLAISGVWIEKLARFAAIVGGIVLVAIALITLVSVIGRALIPFGLRPLRGQFELVEAGTLFAVCAFLPWCHLKKGHASVAVFTDFFGARINKIIDFAGDLLLAILALLMARQLGLGMFDKIEFGETSFLLRYPIWWSYGSALFGLSIWIIVGFWASFNSLTLIFISADTNDIDSESGSSTNLGPGN